MTGSDRTPTRATEPDATAHGTTDPDATAGTPDGTMLAAFLDAEPGHGLTARSTLSATMLGTERGHAVSRPPETPALLLTQTVWAAGRPVLAAKYLFPAGAPLLSLASRR